MVYTQIMMSIDELSSIVLYTHGHVEDLNFQVKGFIGLRTWYSVAKPA
jgi:hypothetical protein